MINPESMPEPTSEKPVYYQPALDESFEPPFLSKPRAITIYTANHKRRTVYEPSDEVRLSHREELRRLNRLRLSSISTAVRPGARLLDNVEPHRANTDFYKLDVTDAFPSVNIENLKRVAYELALEQMDRESADSIVTFIDEDATIPGVPGLPLGYPCSPVLFEIASQPLDKKLEALREKYADRGLAVTRYLDDVTFSGKSGAFTPAPRRDIRETIESFEGYAINTRKSRVQSLARGAVVVTGIALNPDGRLTPAPRLLAQVEQGVHDFEELLATGEITIHDIGVLHGLNSILHITGNPENSATRSVRRLAKQIRSLAVVACGTA